MLPMPTTKSDPPRRCYFVPMDGFVDGAGYRASVVVEGQAGHHPTGSWPYHGRPGETRPYFWGNDLEVAQKIADQMNERMGIDAKTAALIVASSMAAQMRQPRARTKYR